LRSLQAFSSTAGDLPGNQVKLVQAWIALHSDELKADWVMAAAGETPYKIEPLR
jgi:hypothetical protein